MKTIICVMLAALLAFAAPLGVSADPGFPDAAQEPSLKLRVSLFEAENAYADVLELPGYPDAPFYLFLPADCDRDALRTEFPSRTLRVNGEALISGETTDAFREDGSYTVETENGEYPLRVVSSAALPSLYISTESGGLEAVHADKTRKEAGSLTVAEDGAVSLRDAALSYLKGRGNTSWRANEKRSYNIKFDEKTELLGMAAAKKWALVSNNTDPTLMRNALIYAAARETEIPYTADFRFADLYINGNYRGVYMVCEKIEIGKNRIALPDLDDANEKANPDIDVSDAPRTQTAFNGGKICWFDLPNDPDDISGGYLLEYEYPDQFDTEPSAFITKHSQCLILHSPEYATKKEIEYVAGLYGDLEEALLAADGINAKGRHYSEYLDMPSFIDGALLFELSRDSDLGHTSWYLWVPAGEEKFYMGPVWDFDSGLENPEEGLYAVSFAAEAEARGIKGMEEQTFLALLCAHRDFLAAMAERLPTLAEALETTLIPRADALFAQTETGAAADRLRWGGGAYEETARETLKDYVALRLQTMRRELADPDESVRQAAQALRDGTRPSDPAFLWIGGAAAAVVLAGGLFAILRRRKHGKQQSP